MPEAPNSLISLASCWRKSRPEDGLMLPRSALDLPGSLSGAPAGLKSPAHLSGLPR